MRSLILSAFISVITIFSMVPVGALADEYAIIDVKMTLDYRAGDVLTNDSEIILGVGVKLTMMSATGEMVNLEGPVSGKVETLIKKNEAKQEDTALVDAVSALFKPDGKYKKSLAAFRSIGKPLLKTDNPWHVSSSVSGAYCVRQNVLEEFLWNPREDNRTAILSDGSKQVTVTWPEGKPVTFWPEGLPLKDGGEYSIVFKEEDAVTISIALADEGSFKEMALFMLQNGCILQGRKLVKAHARGDNE